MGVPYADPTNTGEWAADLLTDINAPVNTFDLGYVEAWESRESPSGFGYNPVGDETTANNSKNANSAGVQAYTSWQEGLDTITYNLESLPQNAGILSALRSGDSSYAKLSAAQQQGGWKGGGESSIDAPGTSTAFTYGGSYGEVKGAPGVAASSKGVLGDIGFTITHPFQIGEQGGSDIGGAINGVASKAVSGVFGPVAKWIEEGAADVTFVGFGLLLIVVGLLVTFKSEGEESAPVVAAAAA